MLKTINDSFRECIAHREQSAQFFLALWKAFSNSIFTTRIFFRDSHSLVREGQGTITNFAMFANLKNT